MKPKMSNEELTERIERLELSVARIWEVLYQILPKEE